MRKLASIQRIVSLNPIKGADTIETATVLGWHCVVKRGEFKPGDLCVYYEVDSQLPQRPEFEFMAERKYRVRTIKLRGQVSQGLAMPVPADLRKCKEGEDVTARLGVYKYEPGLPNGKQRVRVKQSWWQRLLAWLGFGPPQEMRWPSFLRKTDEIRIQSAPQYLRRHAGEPHYVTEKLDGCSCTIYLRKGTFGVCSRNTEIAKTRAYSDQRRNFWPLVIRLGIEAGMRKLGRNLALQGEIIGPDCNGNKYKLSEHSLHLFNVYDLSAERYLDFPDAKQVADTLGLQWCPILDPICLNHTVDQLVEMSRGKSTISPIHREGLVFRTLKEIGDCDTGRASFKAINPDFLLKFSE